MQMLVDSFHKIVHHHCWIQRLGIILALLLIVLTFLTMVQKRSYLITGLDYGLDCWTGLMDWITEQIFGLKSVFHVTRGTAEWVNVTRYRAVWQKVCACTVFERAGNRLVTVVPAGLSSYFMNEDYTFSCYSTCINTVIATAVKQKCSLAGGMPLAPIHNYTWSDMATLLWDNCRHFTNNNSWNYILIPKSHLVGEVPSVTSEACVGILHGQPWSLVPYICPFSHCTCLLVQALSRWATKSLGTRLTCNQSTLLIC